MNFCFKVIVKFKNKNNANVRIINYKVLFMPVIMLILAYFKMPYVYYTCLKTVIFFFSAYCLWFEHRRNKNILIILNFLIVLVLFNPFIGVHLSRNIWSYIDLEAIFLFLFFNYKNIDNPEKHELFPFNWLISIKDNFAGIFILGLILLFLAYLKSGGRLFLS